MVTNFLQINEAAKTANNVKMDQVVLRQYQTIYVGHHPILFL